MASIEQMLAAREPQAVAPQPKVVVPPATRVASRSEPPVRLTSVPKRQIARAASPNNEIIQTKRVESDPNKRRIWLQLASGDNPDAFAQHFARIRAREPSLFTGISGHVAESGPRARLVIGPFHTREDARLFSDALSTARIDSFPWTSEPGEVIRKLPTR
jgi:cell division septation protein DedD